MSNSRRLLSGQRRHGARSHFPSVGCGSTVGSACEGSTAHGVYVGMNTDPCSCSDSMSCTYRTPQGPTLLGRLADSTPRESLSLSPTPRMHTSTLLAAPASTCMHSTSQYLSTTNKSKMEPMGTGWKAAPISSKTYPRCRRCRRAGCCTGSLHWSCRRPWCSSTCTCSARANAHLPGRGRPVAQAFPSARGARVPPCLPIWAGRGAGRAPKLARSKSLPM